MSGESGRIVRNADDQGAAILVDVIDPIGNGDAEGIGAEVVIIHATRGTLPATAGILEVADQFPFLAVDADDRQMTSPEAVAQLGEIFKLKIALRTGAGGDLLVIDT
jgi:hypothetical protein